MISRTKLLPPSSPVHLVLRGRLFDRLRLGVRQRLTCLFAGGGWGKSVLLSSFLQEHDFPFVWYSLDPTDRDPMRFLAHISEGFRRRTGQVGQRALEEIAAVGEGGDWHFVFATLLNEILDGITEKHLLILDDYQALDGDERVAEVVAALLRLSLPTVHVILSSRERPDLPLNRHRAHGEISELGPDDLRFTGVEIRDLFRTSYGLELDAQQLDALQTYTEGWAIGLRLTGEALLGKPPETAAALLGDRGFEKLIFQYFDEEGFRKMPEPLRDFLKTTSIPHRFTPALAGQLTDRDDPDRIIEDLLGKELFLIRLDEEGHWYRYHHLFRDFLLGRLQAEDAPRLVADLHRRAAGYFRAEDDLDEVIYHVLQVCDYAAAASIIEQRIDFTFSSNFAQRLKYWLTRIPEKEIAAYGGLLFGKGWAHYVGGQWRVAREYLVAALEKAAGEGDKGLLGKAVYFLLVMHISWEEFGEVKRLVEKTLPILPLDSPEMAQSAIMYAIALMFRNRPAAAGMIWNGLIHHPRARQNPIAFYTALAGMGYMYHLPQGRFTEAARQIEDALALTGPCDPSGVRGMFLHFLAGVWQEMGRFEAIPAIAGEAAEEMRKRGLIFTLPSVLALTAVSALSCGDVPRARQTLGEADDILAHTDVRHVWRQHDNLVAKTLFAVHDGDKSAFFAHADLAVATAAKNDDPFACYQVACHLAPHYAAFGAAREARGLLEDAAARMSAFGNPYGEARSRLLLAAVAYDQGDLPPAREQLSAALRLGEDNAYDFLFLSKERAIAARMLPLALAWGLHLPYVSRLLGQLPQCGDQVLSLLGSAGREALPMVAEVLADMGSRGAERALVDLFKDPSPEVRRTARKVVARIRALPPVPLRVRMLGEFKISVGDREVPGSAWKRRMARSVFKYLLLHKEREIGSDRLLGTFFPDVEASDAAKRLHQVTSVLRTVLEPGISTKRESSYLKAVDGSYRLILPEGSWIDAFAFEALCGEGRQLQDAGDHGRAISCYESALGLFRGDLLEEDLFEEWIDPFRVRLTALFLKTLRKFSRLLFDRMDYERCLEVLALAAEREPWDEVGALLTMKCYLALGDRAKAVQTYQRCQSALKEELDLAPGKALTAFYRTLTA
ncbi:Serine/threonine-protein kinase PknK [Desulfuromonas sp. DDH964]|uniref:BTAD domain-containing putative transcriptional regulator n=1 Tax=Desulfuromonas sp. DDH964 TaxID=1823759 RepID=UPI00078EC9D1|nr:BTAD domain-containing putative transcriptional regulator [Desulfuromonas sp. DDH964]AMV73594.1 Serine/threonine-protein kinase PknK [Desulfuromonas sp. DDH964]